MFWAWAGPASQSLTFIDRVLGQPGPPSPHFYRQGLGQPGPPTPHFYRQEPLTFIDRARPARPPTLTFIDRNPSLLSTGPRPAWPGPTPHFYWPTPHFYWPAQTPHFCWLALAEFGRAGEGARSSRVGRAGEAKADQPLFDLGPPRAQAPPRRAQQVWWGIW